MLQGNKELFLLYAGRMKRDYQADTMEGCGSKAGPGSRDRHPAKANHPGWQNHLGWRSHHKHPSHSGWTGWQVQIAIGIKDGRISLLHSLLSTQIVHLSHRLLTSYSIIHRIGIVYPLVNNDNSSPPDHSIHYLTGFRFSLPRLSTDRA